MYVDICASLERVLSSLLSIFSHAFDFRPPAAFRLRNEIFIFHGILLSGFSMNKKHGRADSNPRSPS